MYNKKKTIILTALISFLCSAVLFTFFFSKSIDKSDIVTRLIQTNYDGEIDIEKFDDYKAKGIVDSLGDPHSEFFTKDEFNAFFSEISGNYTGIGIEVFVNSENRIEIASVFPDTPASLAGLRAGDVLKCAGTIEATTETYADIIRFMRGISDEGKASETFKLTVERGGEEITTNITRSDITVPTVSAKDLDGICYLSLTAFTESTFNDFKSAFESEDLRNKKGLIIDLRNNPGGALNVVVDIADLILPECNIVYTKDKKGETEYFNSNKESLDIPIAVLINENSASASEILAGALHDNKKAALVGEKTYGKGSVQNITQFPDGSALKLTVAHYYTPSGVCIDGIGIEPDYEIALPDELKYKSISLIAPEEDTQLQKAIEILTQ